MAELTRLGRYELRRVLGKGAMGVVYEGFDPTLNRRVAVKTILKSVAIDTETERAYSERFVREAQAVARLNHPNIVQVHDFGQQDDVAYIVMEFIEGRELRAFFDEGEKFETAEAVRIVRELLDALEFAHEKNVIHRDVKPANVMLDAQRRVKLADFGVARIQDSDRSQGGTMVGTPAFMSPEQIQGWKVDRRTDLFSVGIILYQLLTGMQPFRGEGAWTVARKIVQEDPPRPSSIIDSVSPVFDAIVFKALAKKPVDRFASAKEFRAALRGTQRGEQPVEIVAPLTSPREAPKASETELEFWRAIQNSGDPAELEFYLEQFPDGTYSQLARHKIAKLRQLPEQDPRSTASLEAELQARRLAEELERQEASAKAQKDAEEQARREKAQRETQERARRESEAKAHREAEEKARRAEALAKQKLEAQAAARAPAARDENATVAIGGERPAAGRRFPPLIPLAAVAAALAVGAFFLLGRAPAPPPAPAVQAPVTAVPTKTEISAAEIEKIRKETEERIRREFADKSAAEQAAAAKAATDKAVQEKQLALKAAAEKTLADKAATDKAAADKAVAEKTQAARTAADRLAAEKVSEEKAAADRLAAERVATEKVAAEKLAAERAAEKGAAARAAAAAKPGWPSVGDRWVYDVNTGPPDKRFQATVEVLAVTTTSVQEVFRPAGGASVTTTFRAGARIVGIVPGLAMFAPYLRAFQEPRAGENWSNIDIQQVGPCMHPSADCSASATVAGREKVTVRAGTFDAWRIVVNARGTPSNSTMQAAGFARAEYVFWYSEEVKRIVKYQTRGVSVSWPDPNGGMELVSYTPAGSK